LLRDGARIVETADDVLEELHGVGYRETPAARTVAQTPARDPLLACLPAGEACDVDELAERSGLTVAHLLPRLFELELRGAVARVGGGRFVLVDRSC